MNLTDRIKRTDGEQKPEKEARVPEWLRRSREMRDRYGFIAVADTTGKVAL